VVSVADPPSPPLNVLVAVYPQGSCPLPGQSGVQLSWLPPVYTGGVGVSPLGLVYDVYNAANTSQPLVTSAQNDIQVALCVPSGLPVAFCIVARNSWQRCSVCSAPSASLTPASRVPEAPTVTSILPSQQAVGVFNVTWVLAVEDPNPATSVLVSAFNCSVAATDLTTPVAVVPVNSAASPGWSLVQGGDCPRCTLGVGVPYCFFVAGVNSNGVGRPSACDFSDACNVTQGALQPSAVTVLAAVARDDGVVVQWAAPANDGGVPIVAYYPTASIPGMGSTVQMPAVLAQTNTSLYTSPVTGLTNGDVYSVSVSALNYGGLWSGSQCSGDNCTRNAIPCDVPGTPVAPSIAGGLGSVGALWTVPAGPALCYVTSYTLYLQDVNTSEVVPLPLPTNRTSYSWTTLPAGHVYIVAVSANNSVGGSSVSPWSAPAGTCTPPGLPPKPEVSGDSDALHIAWEAPTHVPGPLSYHHLRGVPGTSGCVPASPTTFNHSGSTQVVRQGLRDNTEFTVRVCAVNGVGPGPWSPWSRPVSTSKRFLGDTPLWVVGLIAGLPVGLFVLLKAWDCGFRCRRVRVCGVVPVCCCVKDRRLPTLSPSDAAGLYRPLGSPDDDASAEALVPNTKCVLSPVAVSLFVALSPVTVLAGVIGALELLGQPHA
jgi:hypothetical protein